MKGVLIFLLFTLSSVSSYGSNNLTEEVYDSIKSLFMSNYPYNITVISLDSNDTITKIVATKDQFLAKSDSLLFWTYDMVECEWTTKMKTFNLDFGIYQIWERGKSSDAPYYVLLKNKKYEIYHGVDDKMMNRVKELLIEANIDEDRKQYIIEQLRKSRKWERCPY